MIYPPKSVVNMAPWILIALFLAIPAFVAGSALAWALAVLREVLVELADVKADRDEWKALVDTMQQWGFV